MRWYALAHPITWAALRYFNALGADLKDSLGEAHSPETHLVSLAPQAILTGVAVDAYGSD